MLYCIALNSQVHKVKISIQISIVILIFNTNVQTFQERLPMSSKVIMMMVYVSKEEEWNITELT